MSLPSISIIIPNYNSEKFIVKTLESIKNQTYTSWECIIVDDGSTDNSYVLIVNFIKKDLRFKLFKRPSTFKKGANVCRNYGFSISKGKFINWFDSDDIMLPDFLIKKLNNLQNNTAKMVICGGYFVDENIQNKKPMTIFKTNNLYEDYFTWKLKIITNSILFKRSFLLKENLFANKITKGQEFEFFTRIFSSLKPEDYIIVTEYLFYYRAHKNSITNKNKEYHFAYKESESYTIIENLKRSILLNNKVVIQSSFRLLLNLYNKALKHNHTFNINYILSSFKSLPIKNQFLIINYLKFFTFLNTFIKITNTNWEKPIKRITIV